MIETERLIIRPAALSDAGFMVAMLNDPGFVRNIGDRGVRTIAEAQAYLEERMIARYRVDGFGMWIVEAKGVDPVGLCGFVRREGLVAPDLGFAYLAAHCRRGYGLEAGAAVLRHGQDVLGIDPVLAITAFDNLASQALLARLGFIREGEVRLPGHDAPSRLFAIRAPQPDQRRAVTRPRASRRRR